MVSGASKGLPEPLDLSVKLGLKASKATSEIRAFREKLAKLVLRVLPDLKVRDQQDHKVRKESLAILVNAAFKDLTDRL
jgi:hypothetical protein